MANEELRKYLAAAINGDGAANDRAEAEKRYGKVWDTEEFRKEFDAVSFAAPFVLVTKKSDGRPGVMSFQHQPRFYFDFVYTDEGKG